jgi:thiamine pyrophosphate-dependent acetolactate synthase large subunit-like protein
VRVTAHRCCRFCPRLRGTGFTIESLAEYVGIIDQALAAPGPVTMEAVVDPFEPLTPSKVTLGQATGLHCPSRLRGEPILANRLCATGG